MISPPAASADRFAGHAMMIGLIAMLGLVLSVTPAEAADVIQTDGDASDEGLAGSMTLFPIIKDRRLGFIDQRGRVVLEPTFLLSHVGAARIQHPQTTRMLADDPTPEVYDAPSGYRVRFPAFHDGVVMVFKDERIGYIRRDGRVLSPPVFRAAADFHGAVAWAQLEDTTYCLLDTEGRIRIKDVEECSPFAEGLAAVKIKGKYGYIDRRGTTIIAPEYDSVSAFSDGVACAERAGQQWLIGRHGRQIAPVEGQFERFSEGLAVIYDTTIRKYGYISMDGRQTIAPQFEAARPFHEGLAAVVLREQYGFINREGTFVIEPRFDFASSFAKGWAIVRVRDPERLDRFRQGIVDCRGEFVVKPRYESIGPSRNGFTIAKTEDRRCGLVNMQGEYVLEPRFHDLSFTEDFRLVARTGKAVSLLDITGRQILPPEYFDIAPTLREGLRYVGDACKVENKFGYVDAWGNMAIAPRFDFAENFDCGLARVAVDVEAYVPAAFAVIGGAWGYIDRNGDWVWEPTR